MADSTSRAARARPRPRRRRRRSPRAGRTGGSTRSAASATRPSRSPATAARLASTASSPTFCAHRATPASRSDTTYEPSGRCRARSVIVRQSAGAKHEREPVWQTGPAGRTRRSSASPSQSSRISSTASVFPEVSPLRQQLLARAAPEPRLARLARQPLRLRVHPGEHEHAAVAGVLHDRRPQLRLHREDGRRGRAARREATTSRAGSSCRIDASSAACDTSSAAATCCALPAPPDAITGSDTASRRRARAARGRSRPACRRGRSR